MDQQSSGFVEPVTPEIVIPAPAKKFRDKQCAKCGVLFTPVNGVQKHCEEHRKPSKGTDALRIYDTVAQQRSREKERKKQEKKDGKYNSPVEISQKEAKRILAEVRQIKHPHVVDTCVEWADQAARHFKIPFNAHLMTHGLRLTLQAVETKKEVAPPDIQPDEIDGEVIHRTDAYALWDYGFWRQPDSFEQWLTDRYKLKSSAFELSKLLGKEDFGKKHEEWTSFTPRWNPSGLKPGYTQKQGLTWLDAQQSDTEGGKKRYLLVASRNSMKSTWARILALALTITYPDARILIVSETNKLSKKAMKEFRGYFEVAPNNPTLFQQYFGEYAIAPDSGQSLIYDNPLARLGLPQNSVESSSMESANTGSRFDFCIFDDPISRDNGTANEEQRAAAISKHGSIMKLREPAGFALNIQTPWVVDDLGDVMIKRNEEDPERPLAVKIDPVMEILPEAANKTPLELKEEDVVLNFLPKLNWRFVRDEMRSPEGINFFLTQYMTQWVQSEESQWTPTFTLEELQAKVRPLSFFEGNPVLFVAASVDCANSEAITADKSSICIARVIQHEQKQVAFVIDVIAGRWKYSQLAVQIVEAFQKYGVQRAVLERNNVPWQDLSAAIQRQAVLRGYSLPHLQWNLSVGTGLYTRSGISVSAKLKRAKGVEILFDNGQLFFAYNPNWNESLFHEVVRFRGQRSGSSTASKDDQVDSLGQLVATYLQKDIGQPSAPTKEQLEFEQEVYRQNLVRMNYNQIFGSPVPPNEQQQTYTPPPDQDNSSPFERAGFSKYGLTRKAA